MDGSLEGEFAFGTAVADVATLPASAGSPLRVQHGPLLDLDGDGSLEALIGTAGSDGTVLRRALSLDPEGIIVAERVWPATWDVDGTSGGLPLVTLSTSGERARVAFAASPTDVVLINAQTLWSVDFVGRATPGLAITLPARPTIVRGPLAVEDIDGDGFDDFGIGWGTCDRCTGSDEAGFTIVRTGPSRSSFRATQSTVSLDDIGGRQRPAN